MSDAALRCCSPFIFVPKKVSFASDSGASQFPDAELRNLQVIFRDARQNLVKQVECSRKLSNSLRSLSSLFAYGAMSQNSLITGTTRSKLGTTLSTVP